MQELDLVGLPPGAISAFNAFIMAHKIGGDPEGLPSASTTPHISTSASYCAPNPSYSISAPTHYWVAPSPYQCPTSAKSRESVNSWLGQTTTICQCFSFCLNPCGLRFHLTYPQCCSHSPYPHVNLLPAGSWSAERQRSRQRTGGQTGTATALSSFMNRVLIHSGC